MLDGTQWLSRGGCKNPPDGIRHVLAVADDPVVHDDASRNECGIVDPSIIRTGRVHGDRGIIHLVYVPGHTREVNTPTLICQVSRYGARCNAGVSVVSTPKTGGALDQVFEDQVARKNS